MEQLGLVKLGQQQHKYVVFTYFKLIFNFYTPWSFKKTFVFRCFREYKNGALA